MHTFTGNNIDASFQIAENVFERECGEYVEVVTRDGLGCLECENGYLIEDTISDNSLVATVKDIVGGHSSIFIDQGDGTAKKISTTVTSGMYVYGYMMEGPMYETTITNGEDYSSYAKIKGIYKQKRCFSIKNEAGEVVGNMCVGVNEMGTVGQIKTNVKDYSFGDDGKVYIINAYKNDKEEIDREGQVIAHPTIEEETDLSAEPYIAEMLENREGFIEYEIEGAEKTAAYAYYEPYEMIIVAEHSVLEKESTHGGLIIGISIGLLLVSVAIALLFARTLTGPINRLRQVAEKVSMGDMDVAVDIKSKDEIGDLAESFNRMVVAVRFLSEDEEGQ